jgi:hypothetical protein
MPTLAILRLARYERRLSPLLAADIVAKGPPSVSVNAGITLCQ